ncbi:MAG: fasciclin domain-containing protein [Patescibacteria group bacterium]
MAEAGGEEAMEQDMMGDDTIVTLASNTPSLSTLVTAVEAAELVDTLNGEGPFTVFAPTNDAFAALPEGTVDTLLMPENQADLQSVLTYHVVPGTYRAADLSDGMTLTTVQGANITIGVHQDGTVTVNDAPVSMADVEASNGVVHVIDSVILPPEMQ